MTYAHNLRHSIALLESLMTVYPCHSTEENKATLRLAKEEFDELTDPYLRITGERMKYVVSNRNFMDCFGDVVVSNGQRLRVISETEDTYELDDGDGGTYNLPKHTMETEV